jgi:ubiquinone biosynthesis protein
VTTLVIVRRAVQVVLALVALGSSVAFARIRSRGHWREDAAERTAATVERLGGAFLKGGQFLSTRRDLVGPVLAHALGRLQDDVRPMPVADAVRVVDRAGVANAQAVRRAVLDGPVASGSIACVYRVALPHRDVALKVRKPEAVRQITADTRIIRGMARALAFVPVLRGVPMGEIADQLCRCVLDQLDFDRERRNLRRFGELTADLDAVTVPKVVEDMCGDGVLGMDFLDGLDRDRNAGLPGPQLTGAVETLVRAMYESMFLHGFVHVDLHQGNAYFRAAGDVVVVDFGFVYQLSDFARTKFTAFFAGMIDGDGAGCADTLLSTARAVSGQADLTGFRRDVADLVRRNCGRAVRDFSLPRFAAALFDLQRRYGVHADPEFTFPLLSLLALDGVVKQHHPGMDFQLEAAPFVMAGMLDADDPA